MKNFKSIVLLIGAIFAGISMVSAQKSESGVSITQGQKGKFYLFENAAGVKATGLSQDGKYVGGAAEEHGFIYSITEDVFTLTKAAEFLVSPQLYCGFNKVVKNGVEYLLETRYTDTVQAWKDVSLWSMSPNGETIAAMGYEIVTDPRTGKPTIPNFAYVYNNTGKIKERVEPHWPMSSDPKEGVDINRGYGNRVNGINNDGTVLAGHSSWPGHAQWCPVFWDLAKDTSFTLATEEFPQGSFNNTNNDGSIIIGAAQGGSCLVHYNRDKASYTVEKVPFSPGNNYGLLTDMSETGLVLFLQQVSSADVGSRKSYIYRQATKEVIGLEEYVEELYGLKVPIDLFSAGRISDDGCMITGFTYRNGQWLPFAMVLDQAQIFAKPRHLAAEQYKGELSVALQWNKPLQGQYTLKGYNLYCDGQKINPTMLSANVLEFEHREGLSIGVHQYTIEAIYEEGVSAKTDSIKIFVVSSDGCFPVQKIENEIVYNRTVHLSWSLPSSQMSIKASSAPQIDRTEAPLTKGGEASGIEIPTTKAYTNEHIDLIDLYSTQVTGSSCGVKVGKLIYVGHYGNGFIKVFRASDFTLVSEHRVEGLAAISNMVVVGDKLYCATKGEEIAIVDIKTMSLSNRIKTKAGIRVFHLAYIPSLDNNKGGFAYGDWFSMYYCDRYGADLSLPKPVSIKGLVVSGSVYHQGKFYLFSQTGKNLAEVYAYNFEDGNVLFKRDLGDFKKLTSLSTYGFIAGGLSLCVLPDSTLALGAMLQYQATFNHFCYLEIAGAPDLLGYNLYRNGTQVNLEGTYLQGLSYTDVLMEPGEYTYTVEAVNTNCKSMLSNVKTQVQITPIGTCIGPKNLVVEEINNSAVLKWGYESSKGPRLVGFNIYRNGALLEEHRVDFKYTDPQLEKGEYKYRVDAFYENSCVSSDSSVLIVTHEGKPMAPVYLQLEPIKKGKTYDVKTTWELPYFEKPLTRGYCNMPYNGTGMAKGEPMYVVIGWDTTGLKGFEEAYIVGMEYFIGEGILDIEGLVYLNDTLAYRHPVESRVAENNWNTILFDRYISMRQPKEVAIGYKVSYKDKTKPVAVFDAGPGVKNYGDLLSSDGQQWGSLSSSGISANWCINALIVKKRDLEKAKKSGNLLVNNPYVKVLSARTYDLTAPQKINTLSSKASSGLKLLGFNVYRNDNKLNKETIKSMDYTDQNVEGGFYEYRVASIYGGEEKDVTGEVVEITLQGVDNEVLENERAQVAIYPNPAHEQIRINGEYARLEICTFSGELIQCYKGEKEIDVSSLSSGMYLLRFTLENGKSYVRKLVIR